MRGTGGWGSSIAHGAWGRWVKARASSCAERFGPTPGKTYLLELGRVYAAAWNEGEKALESGQLVAAALKSVGQSWDSGRGQLFDRLVTSELSKIVAENQPEAEAKPTNLAALALAWRGFVIGLNSSKK